MRNGSFPFGKSDFNKKLAVPKQQAPVPLNYFEIRTIAQKYCAQHLLYSYRRTPMGQGEILFVENDLTLYHSIRKRMACVGINVHRVKLVAEVVLRFAQREYYLIINDVSANFNDCQILNNTGRRTGGIEAAQNATAKILGCIFSGNISMGNGGALCCRGEAKVEHTTITSVYKDRKGRGVERNWKQLEDNAAVSA